MSDAVLVTRKKYSDRHGAIARFDLPCLTMHFGDAAPLRAALSNLKSKVPELLTTTFDEGFRGHLPTGSQPGALRLNSVEVLYTDASGGQLEIIATAYDSDAAAKAGLDQEMRLVQAAPDATEMFKGVKAYEYVRYGGMRLQAGPHTFDLRSSPNRFPGALQKTASRSQRIRRSHIVEFQDR